MNDDALPDPDKLFAAIECETARSAHGRLKIFFGACAGVGKTYAMLAAAQQKLAEGTNVLVGVVETHGRGEIDALLDGMPQLARRYVDCRSRTLTEFDLDTALVRHPQLIVVDELAHTNVAGSRHRKRWQDVQELLDAGIDVWTTLNVQHLEGLNDIVGNITGMRVHETVPDQVFEAAEEVSLVDLPPEELLARLKAGKVHLGEVSTHAADNFFRIGKLIALRELALRRTADRVDAQMRAWRANRTVEHVWHTHNRLIACIGPGSSETLVRNAARLAANLQAEWIALSIETPDMVGEPEGRRTARLNALKLAASLGAEVCTLAAVDAADAIVRFARCRNAGRVILGGSRATPWRRLLRPAMLDRLATLGQDLEITVVALPRATRSINTRPAQPLQLRGYLWAILICATTCALAVMLGSVFDLPNVVMIFLMAVVGISLTFGRGPGAFAAFLSVAAFDYFFVLPQLAFSVDDTQYLFTFALMLIVALVIGQLAAKLKFDAIAANRRELRSIQQAELSRALSAALSTEQIVEVATQRLAGMLQMRVAVLLPDAHGRMRAMRGTAPELADLTVAQWVFDHDREAGRGTGTLPASEAHYLPLRTPMHMRGVLSIAAQDDEQGLNEPDTARVLDSSIGQIAQALERVHYAEVARDALVTMESERLRNSLLAAVSHDLRTPLTGLVGMADTLAATPGRSRDEQQMVTDIHQTAHRLAALVTNLLDMARLQTGRVTLRRDWCAIEEVIETATRQLSAVLADHDVHIHIAEHLPLCEFDPALIERVLANLLDNAAKYTPPGARIDITAALVDGMLQVSVDDDGPGLPEGSADRLFEMFERGSAESARPGVGLGLAICRAIIQAHGGLIETVRRQGQGASFRFRLPQGTAPQLEDE